MMQAAFQFDAPAPVQTPTLAQARELGRVAMQRVEAAAGDGFSERAMAFVVEFLRKHGRASGEVLTDACKAAGIKPARDDRAFGPVFLHLLRTEQIQIVGACARRKGHGTAGGRLYALGVTSMSERSHA